MAGWHRGRRSLPGPRGSARSQGRGGCGGSRPGRAHRRRAPGPAGHPCPAYRRRAGTRGAPRTPGSGRQAPARGARPGSRPPPAPGPAASLPSPPLPCLPCRRGAARRGARRGDVAVAVCQRPAAGRLPPVQGNGRGAVRGGSGVRPPLLRLVLPVWRGGAPEGSGLTGAVGSAPGRLSARPCSACGPGRPIPSHSVPSHPIPSLRRWRGRRAPTCARSVSGQPQGGCPVPGRGLAQDQVSVRMGTGCLRSGTSRWEQS